MGTFTAKLAIDRKLRKELMENYDLIEVVNKGRYYTAKAYSKSDKKALFQELTIEKFPCASRKKEPQHMWKSRGLAVALGRYSQKSVTYRLHV